MSVLSSPFIHCSRRERERKLVWWNFWRDFELSLSLSLNVLSPSPSISYLSMSCYQRLFFISSSTAFYQFLKALFVFKYTHTHTCSPFHTLKHTRTYRHAYALSLTHILTFTRPLHHTYTNTHKHQHTHTHAHSLFLTHTHLSDNFVYTSEQTPPIKKSLWKFFWILIKFFYAEGLTWKKCSTFLFGVFQVRDRTSEQVAFRSDAAWSERRGA